jgi:hypothetical protein
MGKPEVKRTIINVKGMDAEQWERAKLAANRQDETMGEWLSRAVKQLAAMEEGGREFGPGERTERKPLTAEQVAALMQAAAQLALATGKPAPKSHAHGLRAVVDDLTRQARGLPPKPVKPRANQPPQIGKTALIEGGRHE